MKLAEDSSYLTTFNTPYGRYRFFRLPFGLKSSQDEFQRKIDESYEGLEGMVALVDDILVYGKSREEHDKNLKAVLERSRQKGIKYNSDKLVVGVSEVDYFGHLLTSEGLKPDPSKVSAIKDMQPPCNKAELETVLGMINYLAKFSPNLSEVTTPMRQLLCSKNEFGMLNRTQPSKRSRTSLLGHLVPYFHILTQIKRLLYRSMPQNLGLKLHYSKMGSPSHLLTSH